MLYEINTLPWSYSRPDNHLEAQAKSLQMQWDTLFIVATILAMFAILFSMFLFRRRRIRDHAGGEYEEIKDVQIEVKV
jgi:hypothetical protein